MQAREDSIRKSLDDARQAREELQRLKSESAKMLADARVEAETILSRTRDDASRFRDEMKEKLLLLRRIAVGNHEQVLTRVQVDCGDAAGQPLEDRKAAHGVICRRSTASPAARRAASGTTTTAFFPAARGSTAARRFDFRRNAKITRGAKITEKRRPKSSFCLPLRSLRLCDLCAAPKCAIARFVRQTRTMTYEKSENLSRGAIARTGFFVRALRQTRTRSVH